jgi:RNA polymerase sigma factor (TIGR02999 family)
MSLTQLLELAHAGDHQAAEDLFRVVYDDLRRIACQYIQSERSGLTLQPTALVHEAYLRLFGSGNCAVSFAGRAAFYATVARAMRHILVDAARRRQALKRGGKRERQAVDLDKLAQPETGEELLALHEALEQFALVQPRIAELVTLRFFGGLTLREAAETLGIAPRTADVHWAYARAWLLEAMQQSPQE